MRTRNTRRVVIVSLLVMGLCVAPAAFAVGPVVDSEATTIEQSEGWSPLVFLANVWKLVWGGNVGGDGDAPGTTSLSSDNDLGPRIDPNGRSDEPSASEP